MLNKTEFRLSSHPQLQTMSQGTHTSCLWPTSHSGGVRSALFCLWYGVRSLPTSKTEPELHLTIKDVISKRNPLLMFRTWLVWQHCSACACAWHTSTKEKYRKGLWMGSSLACSKTWGFDLASSKGFPATQHIVGCATSHRPAFAAADTAWIRKTDVNDGPGQGAVCIFHRMVRILQAEDESSQSDTISMSSLGSFPCKLGWAWSF